MKLLNSILWCGLLASCTLVPKPPDVFAFKSLEPMMIIDEQTQHILLEPSPACMKAIEEVRCGYGVSIITGKEIFVGENPETFFNGKSWSQLKDESVYLPAVESYSPLATYVINSCKKMECAGEVTRFKIKFDGLPNGDIKEEIKGPQDKPADNN